MEKKTFTCPICSSMYATKNGLKRHISIFHEKKEPEKVFKCSIYENASFANKSHMKNHIESLMHLSVKFVVCSLWKNFLGIPHKKNHEGIKSFQCIICDISTAKNDTLKKHVKTIHEGLKPFKCDHNYSRQKPNIPQKKEKMV